jgi:cell wall-associated NlpC family hydrolase
MVAIDPRINAFRPGIAAAHLKGKVDAQKFVEGVRHDVIEPNTAVRTGASHWARQGTEALMGETFVVYERNEEGWAWGQLETDNYVGWISGNALAPSAAAATHKVSVPRTLCFPGPDIKLPVAAALPMGARVVVARQDERFAITANDLYVPVVHLAPLKATETDFVSVAEQFLNTPYLWGGKTSLGLDCSGLVQVALQACGVACPRDSDMQEMALGKLSSLTNPRRGDLVFWKGHVAIARDGDTLLHANAHHMMVASEPLRGAIARIKAAGSEVTSVRRL